MKEKYPFQYTSSAKDWWHKNSDKLGAELDWDTFCKIWMAAINKEELLNESNGKAKNNQNH